MRSRASLATALACCACSALAPSAARAEPHPREQRELALGVAAHLLGAAGDSCTQDGDQVSCTDFVPFAGADLTLHYWPVDVLGVGVRLSGSKDLDGTEGAGSDGVSWDPDDQWLWRASAEARLDPPIIPGGLWIGAELGLALLREVQQSRSGTAIREDAASRAAPLFGLALGWDLWLGRSLTLTPELRAQVLLFGDPPELSAGAEGRDYGTSSWLELGLRLAVVL